MNQTDRRNFLKLLGSGAMAGSMQASIGKAMALPANNRTRSIDDVEHVIFLMQENRSFDHYFGMLQGVRGYNDPRAVRLPSGDSVWKQPHGSSVVMPFHPDAPDMGMQFLADLPHDWKTTHEAWNDGKWDGWIAAKSTTCMAHMTRDDVPFHYALADAFTICDAYHCSIMGATDPNRYYMWSGWVGNDGSGGGPVVDNAEAGYGWSTYPERLEKAGVSWKVYQDIGTGLTAAGSWGWTSNPYIGNYGDSSLLYFNQYRNAPSSSPLALKARTGTNVAESGGFFDILRADVKSGNLPQVSWVVAPEAYSEHPNWPANYGAWYVSQVLDILTEDPEVWSKTALFVMFDENDGFFDHIVPPSPPTDDRHGKSTVSIENELFPGSGSYAAGPYGFGPRVPMVVVSPWSRGGWVNSEVFDHTSLIRFLETRFAPHYPGLIESNITPWRRAVSGDLTSAFDFSNPNGRLEALPATSSYAPKDSKRHSSYVPAVPSEQATPVQETGIRRARALPYNLHVHMTPHHESGKLVLGFRNSGDAGAVLHVRDATATSEMRYYTVEARKRLSDVWDASTAGAYDLSVYGPNGFFRSCKGNFESANATRLGMDTRVDHGEQILHVDLINHGFNSVRLLLTDAYTGQKLSGHWLRPMESHMLRLEAGACGGWYDLTVEIEGDSNFRMQLAGHIENGRDSITDPLMGGVADHLPEPGHPHGHHHNSDYPA
ncbi:phospholipase C, phosphocholine-specific [Acetobacter sacchari]|uniref:phospholipase C n=1 Tax=Acetobacter sacchari TaxID=2661687 RepID=A0ABS3LRM5_9PROT|nr:phospholipase C, phosphocholine-specific [Acetobacter sacchari]MBO1358558.1 phospholipase C, phosphocholine-specific [Acetobacter sacchari]